MRPLSQPWLPANSGPVKNALQYAWHRNKRFQRETRRRDDHRPENTALAAAKRQWPWNGQNSRSSPRSPKPNRPSTTRDSDPESATAHLPNAATGGDLFVFFAQQKFRSVVHKARGRLVTEAGSAALSADCNAFRPSQTRIRRSYGWSRTQLGRHHGAVDMYAPSTIV